MPKLPVELRSHAAAQARSSFFFKHTRRLLLSSALMATAVALSPTKAAAQMVYLGFPSEACGPAMSPTVTCNNDGMPMTDANPYENGIRYRTDDDLTVIVDGSETPINIVPTIMDGDGNDGVLLSSGPLYDYIDMMGVEGDYSPMGETMYAAMPVLDFSQALSVETQGDVSITTTGEDAQGIYVGNFRGGSISIKSNADIATNGAGSEGIYAVSEPFFGGLIVSPFGMMIEETERRISEGPVRTDIDIEASGNIETRGVDSTGILASGFTPGNVSIKSSADITTHENSSGGVLAGSFNFGTADSIDIEAVGGSITTLGDFSPGVHASNFSGGPVNIISNTEIMTSGELSPGISADVLQGTANIDVTGGSIKTSGGTSDGIRVNANLFEFRLDLGAKDSASAMEVYDRAEPEPRERQHIATINVAGEIEVTGGAADGKLSDEYRIAESAESEVPPSYGIYLSATTNFFPEAICCLSGITSESSDYVGGMPTEIDDREGSEFWPTATINILESGRVFSQNGAAIAEGDTAFERETRSVPINTTLTIAGEVSRPQATDTAIDLSTGDDTVVLLPTAKVKGIIDGGAHEDAFKLDGAAGTKGVLDVDQSAVINFESFEKVGAGTWEIVGDSSDLQEDALAPFLVSAGELVVNGTLGNIGFVIAEGATLSGSGELGEVLVNGIIAPGNSIGTLSMTGDLTLSSSSDYEVEVAADGSSDLIDVTGAITLGGGTVTPILVDPAMAYTDGQQFTIATASGGLTGTFGGINDTSALVDYALTYDANNAFLNLIIGLNFDSFATTFNQEQIAGVLGSFDADGDPEVFNALLSLDADQLAAAYDSMQGEIYASGQAIAAQAGQDFSNVLMNIAGTSPGSSVETFGFVGGLSDTNEVVRNRINASAQPATNDDLAKAAVYGSQVSLDDAPEAPAYAFWASGYGAFSRVDSDGNGSEWDSRSGGFGAGVEASLGTFAGLPAIVGIAGGYTRTTGEIDALSQEVDINSYHIGLYSRLGAERFADGLAWRGALTYAFHDLDSTRNIAFGGVNRTASADYDGNTFTVASELRYNFAFDPGFGIAGTTVIAPVLRVDGAFNNQDSFAETGAGSLNLTGTSQDYDAFAISAGLSFGGDYELFGRRLRSEYVVAYERALADVLPQATVALNGASGFFGVRGPLENRNRLRLGSRTAININETTSISFATDSVYSKDRIDYSGKAAFKIRF